MKNLPSSDKEWENFKFPRLPGCAEAPTFPSKIRENKQEHKKQEVVDESQPCDVSEKKDFPTGHEKPNGLTPSYPKESVFSFDDGDDSDGGGDELEDISFPELPENFYIKKKTWKYHPKKRALIHESLSKKISVSDLNLSYKIIRLVSVLYNREDLDVEDLLEALGVASMFHYRLTIQEVIDIHSDGEPIVWPEPSFETFELVNSQEKTNAKSNNRTFNP